MLHLNTWVTNIVTIVTIVIICLYAIVREIVLEKYVICITRFLLISLKERFWENQNNYS